MRRQIAALLAVLALLYALERLGIRIQGTADIQSYIYALGLIIVVAIVAAPGLWHLPAAVLIALCLTAYLVAKVILLSGRPALGGVHTYLLVTEAGLLSLAVWLAHRVARKLQSVEEVVRTIALDDIRADVRDVDDALDEIQTELNRSRRYQRPLSVVVMEPETVSMRGALPRALLEAERGMMNRYVTACAAQLIAAELRRSDLLLHQGDGKRLIIVSPETTSTDSTRLVNRIETAVGEGLGVSMRYGIASFPHGALTFDDLLRQAETSLRYPDTTLSVPLHVAAEADQDS